MALDPTHSSVSPARCRVCAQPCHACMPTVLVILLSLFSPSFSLSEWVSGLSVVPQARWTYTVLQLTCFHKCPTYSPEKSLLPTAYFACQSHLQQLLLKFNFLTVNIRDAAAVLSHDRLLVCCQNFWISHYGKLESLPWEGVHLLPAPYDFSIRESATSLDQSCSSPRCVCTCSL